MTFGISDIFQIFDIVIKMQNHKQYAYKKLLILGGTTATIV